MADNRAPPATRAADSAVAIDTGAKEWLLPALVY
jgi:hypothetical protein